MSVRSKAQNRRNRPLPLKKVAATIKNGNTDRSPLMFTRRCFARIYCHGSVLHILIKNGFSSRTAHLLAWGILLCTGKLWFANDLLPLNLLDYGTWGILRAKGNAMGHPKLGSLKQTVWQMHAAKVR